jgi:hypothetical protein
METSQNSLEMNPRFQEYVNQKCLQLNCSLRLTSFFMKQFNIAVSTTKVPKMVKEAISTYFRILTFTKTGNENTENSKH